MCHTKISQQCFVKMANINLNNYFQRIGLDGVYSSETVEPNLETLTRIQWAHLSTITFENLDVVMKKPIDMSLSAVESKLVDSRRGGYCFEQNTLLLGALRAIGFKVTPMLTRVRWCKTPETQTTFTHLVLIVNMSPLPAELCDPLVKDCTDAPNTYLVDVGFGGIGSVAPLRMDISTPQETDALYRITRCADDPTYKMLSWCVGGVWSDMYAVHLEPAWDIDQQMSNFWSYAHPSARFCTSMFVARLIGDERHYILNNTYNIRYKDGSLQSTKLESFPRFVELLSTWFIINVPSDPEFEVSVGRYLFPK